MPLGDQFRNTYWTTDSGLRVNALDTGKGRPEYTVGSDDPEDFDKPVQGMLFHPHTGTGRRQDPLISQSERDQAINAALGTDYSNVGGSGDPDTYYREALTDEWKTSGQLRRDPNFKTFPSKEETSKDRLAIAGAMNNSGMTLDEIRGVEAQAVIDNTERRSNIAFHRAGWASPRTGGRIVIKPTTDVNSLSESLMHELGHSRDTSISDISSNLYSHTKTVKGADPVQEGLADAHMDRHHTYKDFYPEHIAGDLVNRLAQGKDRGYGLGYWTSQHDKALYAATRIAAAQNPDAFKDIPTRSELAVARTGDRYTDKNVQKLMLGHLVEHHPGVSEALSAIDEHIDRQVEARKAVIREHHGENFNLSRGWPKPSGLGKAAGSSRKYYADTKLPAKPGAVSFIEGTPSVRQASANSRFREHEVEPHPELDLGWPTSKPSRRRKKGE